MKDAGIAEIIKKGWRRLVVAIILVAIFALCLGICKAFHIKVPDKNDIVRFAKLQADLQKLDEEWQAAREKVEEKSAEIQRIKADLDQLEAAERKGSYAWNWVTKWGLSWKEWKAARAAYDAKQSDYKEANEAESGLEKDEEKAQQKYQTVEAQIKDGAVLERVVYYSLEFFRRWKLEITAFIFFYVTPVGRWMRRTFVWFGPGLVIQKWGRPLVFPPPENPTQPTIQTSEDKIAPDIVIKEGEEAWFRPAYLDRTNKPKAAKVGLKWAFSWKYPLLTACSGLWGLSVFNGDEKGITSIKLSDPEDATTEFRIVSIPEGQSLILRSHHIVGVIFPTGRAPDVRRHWRIHKLQAWIIGQVIYFEFRGPISVILKGARGLQWHNANSDEHYETRMIPGSLVAFSPALSLFSLRSLNFWQYIFGIGPVFDYSFTGDAIFISQQATERSEGSGMLRFGAAVGDGIMKLIGF